MSRMTADERRASVLRAARPEFAAGGLAGTSTEAIARRAGVSQPYLFRLFPSKKGLFLASMRASFATVEGLFTEVSEGLTGQAALDAMGAAYRRLLDDRELLLHQLQAYAACDDPEIRDEVRAAFGRVWRTVASASGAGPDELRGFFAMGMLMTVAAAMDLPAHDAAWALDCLPPDVEPPG